MTAQEPDTLTLDGESYEITHTSGGPLPTPEDFGLTPFSFSTGCHRGYVVHYEIADGRLSLSTLAVTTEEQQYPVVRGVSPRPNGYFDEEAVYENLGVSCSFTGGMLIGRTVAEQYLHWMSLDPWHFEDLVEVLFDAGELTDVRDCSELMDSIRSELAGISVTAETDLYMSSVERVGRTWFSREYDFRRSRY